MKGLLEEANMTCSYCNLGAQVVWEDDGCGAPEFCPRCGEQMDYDVVV